MQSGSSYLSVSQSLVVAQTNNTDFLTATFVSTFIRCSKKVISHLQLRTMLWMKIYSKEMKIKDTVHV